MSCKASYGHLVEIRADTLVRAAMTASGAQGPSELARKLGLTGYPAPKRVSRWLKGENEPRFEETIRLLELAGWLSEGRVKKALAAAQKAADEAARRADALTPPAPPSRATRKRAPGT